MVDMVREDDQGLMAEETVEVELSVKRGYDGKWARVNGAFPVYAWDEEPSICIRELLRYLRREI